MYIDYYYLVLVLPAIILAMIAQQYVKSSFNKYSKIATRRGVTGTRAAETILRQNGVHVGVQSVDGNLTDHYDPKQNVIRLSNGVRESISVAAVGIAAHEAGHALQHAEGYAPIKVRTAIVPVANIGSTLSIPLVFIGLMFMIPALYYAGIILFSLVVVFQLVTLPVEFNASRRALETLESTNLLDEDERKQAKKVLTAAALTYVAALAVSIAQLLRLVALSRGRRRR